MADRRKQLMINDLLDEDLIRRDEVERIRIMSKTELLALRVRSEAVDKIYCHRILDPIFQYQDTPFINCKLECINGKTHLNFTLFSRVPIDCSNKYENTLINLGSERVFEIMATSNKVTVNFVHGDIPMLTADVDTDAHREAKEALKRSRGELFIIEFRETIGLPNFLETLPPKLEIWFIAHSEFFRTIPIDSWSQVRSFVARNSLTRQAWQYLMKLRVVEKITVTTQNALTENDLTRITGQWRNNQRIITLWFIKTENANYNHVDNAEYERFSNYRGFFHREVLTVSPCHSTGGIIFSVIRNVMSVDDSRSPSVEQN